MGAGNSDNVKLTSNANKYIKGFSVEKNEVEFGDKANEKKGKTFTYPSHIFSDEFS